MPGSDLPGFDRGLRVFCLRWLLPLWTLSDSWHEH